MLNKNSFTSHIAIDFSQKIWCPNVWTAYLSCIAKERCVKNELWMSSCQRLHNLFRKKRKKKRKNRARWFYLSLKQFDIFFSLKLLFLIVFPGNPRPCYGHSFIWFEWNSWHSARSCPPYKCYCSCSWSWTCARQQLFLSLQGVALLHVPLCFAIGKFV